MAEPESRSIAYEILKAVLKPFIRFCVRNSHSYQDLVKAAKDLFVTVAQEEIAKASPKINVSRISVMTGLHRDEITRILREREIEKPEPISVFGRVIGQWRQDRRFISKTGEPRTLTFKGRKNEFKDLCASISTAINYGTILFELKRQRFVEVEGDKVKLLRQLYTFHGDPRKGYELLGRDIDSLIASVEQNLAGSGTIANLHIRTTYDNVAISRIPIIREWLVEEGKAFHKKVREFISQHDKDINPDIAYEEGGGFVALGTFSVTNPSPLPAEEDSRSTGESK